MITAKDLKATLNLPRTDFPMKANLALSEPARLEIWKRSDLYGQIRQARRGAPIFLLHDGPPYANGHIHLGHVVNKTLKDFLVRSRNLEGYDTPYLPGWDCHGLPIELQVDRNLGSKKKDLSPLAFRKACRSYAEKYVAIQRKEFERLGILGEWNRAYLTMNPSYQAAIVRQLATFIEKKMVYRAKKSVHWCISCRTALAEAEVEYDDDHRSPSIDVRFPLADEEVERLAAHHGALRGRRIFAVIWTTTPWTLPANLALAFHPDYDYAFYEVIGGKDVVLLAERLRDDALKRWRNASDDVALGPPMLSLKGRALEGLRFRHPWIDRDSPAVLAEYVTLEAGTGVVHTAPGHGWDDYLTGTRYALEIYCPVDEAGRFLPEIERFAGRKVFDANPDIISLLKQRNALLQSSQDRHSYPVCWRCKHPVIFRATEQWFIGLDIAGFREQALAAVSQARWYPGWGEERIRNMIATRPDWCISRQRLWGVPIPAFYCGSCGGTILTADLARRSADLFERESADAWYEREAAEILPPGFRCSKCGGDSFEKERDILDVWFDSGSSYPALRALRPELPPQADCYLEGSDQHRGWFHSSLLIGIGTVGRAPYKQVITHGFTVDAEGRKMSKTEGNVVDPQKIVVGHGAEILRLWVAMTDYREDMRISEEMLRQLAEAYRKIRNTCRYMLANLFDFVPARDAVDEARLEEIDRFALTRQRQFTRRVRAAYEGFEFHVVYHQLQQYCAVDLSSFYLDVLKDRLYCDAADGPRRRSSQTVLWRITRDLARLMAPVLPITADEVWSHLPGQRPFSVHLDRYPDIEQVEESLLSEWQKLLEVRSAVTKALEGARAERRIASSLEAHVRLRGPESVLAPLKAYESRSTLPPGNLASLFIVSGAELHDQQGELKVEVTRAAGDKCERCWSYSTQSRQTKSHSIVCERCAAVLENA